MDMNDLTALGGQWLNNLGHDLSRYVIFAVSVWLVLWVLLARPLAPRRLRPERPPARQLVTEFAMSVRSIAIFSTVGLAMFALERADLLPGPALAAQWGFWWGAFALVVMIVAHDAWFYWTHRAMHDRRLFRTFHRRHHRSHNPSPFTAYSFDIAEAAVQASFVPVWVVLMPTPWEVVGLFMLHQIARNTLGHSGYELFPARQDGRPVFDFLTTTTHHDIHHAEAGWNYGLYFTWWDRLMGTEHPDYHARFAAAAGKAPRTPTRGSVIAAITLAALALGAPTRADASALSDISGAWATPGLGAVVVLAPCAADDQKLCGRLQWVWEPRSVRSGSVGVLMLRDFTWDGAAFRGGVLRNPEDGRDYRGVIRPEGDVLRLQGCAGPFCREQTWRRLLSIPRPS